MMRKKPRVPVSVVVITYRRPILLGECLQSILSQSVIPQEVLVVDNAPDQSAKQTVIQAGLRAPCPVRYLWERRKGTVYARNTGFSRADAEVVAFIDDDCIADLNWLKNGYRSMSKNHIGALTGRNINAYPGNMYAVCEHYDSEQYLHRYMFRDNEIIRTYVVDTKNLFLRRGRMIEKNIRHDTRFAAVNILEDMDLAMQMNWKGTRICFDPSVIVRHKGRTGLLAHLKREMRKGRAQRMFERKWGSKMPAGNLAATVTSLKLDEIIFKRQAAQKRKLYSSVFGKMGVASKTKIRFIMSVSYFVYLYGYILELLRNYLYDVGRVNRKP